MSLTFYRGEKEEMNLISFVWNSVMANIECCGLDNYTDFKNSMEWQRSKLNLQASKFVYIGKQIDVLTIQILPSACCILDQSKYPQTISPQDAHCVFVPTKYNSYWMQVNEKTIKLSMPN